MRSEREGPWEMRDPAPGSDSSAGTLRASGTGVRSALVAGVVACLGLVGCAGTATPSGPGPSGTYGTSGTPAEAPVPVRGETPPPTTEGDGPVRAPAPTPAGESLPVPDPSWMVRDLDGGETTLAALRGAPVFVNLWATWCPPCVAEIGSIARLAEAVRAAGHDEVRFLLVSSEDPGTVRDFARRRLPDLPDPVTLALEASLAPEAFGELILPTTVILDARGRMVLRHTGAAAWDAPAMVDFLGLLARRGDR